MEYAGGAALGFLRVCHGAVTGATHHGTGKVLFFSFVPLDRCPVRASESDKALTHAQFASALIISNFDRALHTLLAQLICAHLRD
jgi:hypothetical protein